MTTRCFSCWLTLAVAAVVIASGCSETKAPPAAVVPSQTPQPGGPIDGVKNPPKATKVVPGESAPAANASPATVAPEQAAGDAVPKANAPRVNAPKKGTKAPVKPTAPLAEPI
jgi:hypothetical protein